MAGLRIGELPPEKACELVAEEWAAQVQTEIREERLGFPA
jgi:hypothetical protein